MLKLSSIGPAPADRLRAVVAAGDDARRRIPFGLAPGNAALEPPGVSRYRIKRPEEAQRHHRRQRCGSPSPQ